jgi:hypothetical protein
MTPTKLTGEHRAVAAAKSVAARRIRADLKARLKRGETDLVQVFREAETDAVLSNMEVSEFLRALPTVGDATARRIMTDVGIAPTRRIRSLTPRQRATLLDIFSPPNTQ